MFVELEGVCLGICERDLGRSSKQPINGPDLGILIP